MINSFSHTFTSHEACSVPAWVIPHLVSLDDDLEVNVFTGMATSKQFMSAPGDHDETRVDTHGDVPQVTIAVERSLHFHADEMVLVVVTVITDDPSGKPGATAPTYTVTDLPRPEFVSER